MTTDTEKWRRDLEEEVAFLRQQLKTICGEDSDRMYKFKLTPQEERIVRLLLIREFVPYDAIEAALSWDKHEVVAPATVKVFVSHIRRKMPAIKPWLVNKSGRGYYLAPEGKHWIKAEMMLMEERQ